MRPGVDAPREPRDDDMARPRDPARNLLGESDPAADALREPTTATFERRRQRQIAADGDKRRRRMDQAQQRRIIRLVEPNENRAAVLQLRQLRLDRGYRRNGDRPARLAAGGRAGNASSAARAEPKRAQQSDEAARADIVAAKQPQPVKSFGLAEGPDRPGPEPLRHGLPIRVSVPARSRAILEPCFSQRIAASAAKTIAEATRPSASRKAGVKALASSAASEEKRVIAATPSQPR